jgi:ketosteroid isomerase-like protein
MTEERNTATTRALFDHMNAGELGEVLSLLADDGFTWENPTPDNVPFGGSYQGRDGFTRYVGELFDALEMGQLEIEEMIAQGDKVVVIGHESSRVRSTGRRYAMDYVMVFDFNADGRITHAREYVDTAALSAAF